MGILSGIGRYVGGLLLFMFLSSFIFLFAINSSGILTPQYTNKIISSVYNSSLNSTQLSALKGLNVTPSGVLGLLAGSSGSGGSNLLISLLSSSKLYEEELISLVFAVVGFVLVIISSSGGSKFKNTGKTILSISILTAATVFGIFYVFLPMFSSIDLNGVLIKLPLSLFSPFTDQVFLISAALAVASIILLILGHMIDRRSSPIKLVSQRKP